MLLASLVLSSCVGTVEDASKVTTESSEQGVKTDLGFNGIVDLVPVSHDKLEVYFYPASGGSKEYLYQIYVGNLPEPVNVVEQVLTKDYRSMYRYTLTGLDIGTEYIVKVDVKDRNSKETVVTNVTKKAFTFSNYVADFAGLSSVSNVSGFAGIDSIRVRWPHATTYPGNLLGSDRDPQAYEITILDSSMLTPKAFNDFNLTPADGKIVKTVQYNPIVNEAVVRGLVSGKIYYVNVRAIHEGTIEDPNNPKLRNELNNKYFTIKTLEADASMIEFDVNNYLLTPSAGAASKNSLHLNWGVVTGIFDHFRVFYAVSPSLFPDVSAACEFKSSQELLGGQIGCKKASPDLLATDLNDLAINQLYQVQLYICINIECTENVQLSVLQEGTGNLLAGFSGIQNIKLAENLEQLGTVTLVYGTPDFSSGYFDGLAIEMTTEKPELIAWIDDPDLNPRPATEIITEDGYSGNFSHISFDYKEDSTVIVQGIDYSAANNYCFTMYPFVYDEVGSVVYKDSAASWTCVTTKVGAPTKKEFEGIREAEVSERTIFINWNLPTKGVYSHFEVLYRKATGPADTTFNYDSVIEETTVNYDFSYNGRVLVDKNIGYDVDGNPELATFVALNNMANGYYNIGVLTYANLGYVIRSEKNIKIFQCYIDGISAANCTPL